MTDPNIPSLTISVPNVPPIVVAASNVPEVNDAASTVPAVNVSGPTASIPPVPPKRRAPPVPPVPTAPVPQMRTAPLVPPVPTALILPVPIAPVPPMRTAPPEPPMCTDPISHVSTAPIPTVPIAPIPPMRRAPPAPPVPMDVDPPMLKAPPAPHVSAPVPSTCSSASNAPVPPVPTTTTLSIHSNLVGFEDSNWYKIRNVGDNNVIQVDPTSSQLICMPEDKDLDEVQRFQAIRQQSGGYRIVAKFQKSPTVFQVWDYLKHRKVLIQRKQSGSDKLTQKWVSEHVPGYNSLYLIQSFPSVESQSCLKNMGPGQQITLIDKSAECVGDHYIHWVLEFQDVSNN